VRQTIGVSPAFAELTTATILHRFGVCSSSAETNSARRSGEHLIARAVACVHMMRIRNTYSARARIVRKYEIGKSRVVRAVTLTDYSVLELTTNSGDLSRVEMEICSLHRKNT